MAKRLSYERYLWFHRKIKSKRYPKLKELMKQFEISRRQAAREIEHMRIFFNAPVEYSNEYKGYYYEDDSFEFPVPMVSQEEVVSLIVAKRLSVTIPDQKRKQHLDALFENLSAYFDLDITELEKKISLKNVRYSKVLPEVFDTVLMALGEGKKLEITYRSVYKKESSQRIVHPLHLVLYMGSWHIMAFCETKKGIRDFALSRIRSIRMLEEAIDEHPEAAFIKQHMDEAHGIFFEGKRKRVVLRFNERIAEYVREQVWFPGQEVEEDSCGEGCLTLSFDVTDFREVSREILSFGADVEVVEPEELKQMIKEQIRRLAETYGI